MHVCCIFFIETYSEGTQQSILIFTVKEKQLTLIVFECNKCELFVINLVMLLRRAPLLIDWSVRRTFLSKDK